MLFKFGGKNSFSRHTSCCFFCCSSFALSSSFDSICLRRISFCCWRKSGCWCWLDGGFLTSRSGLVFCCCCCSCWGWWELGCCCCWGLLKCCPCWVEMVVCFVTVTPLTDGITLTNYIISKAIQIYLIPMPLIPCSRSSSSRTEILSSYWPLLRWLQGSCLSLIWSSRETLWMCWRNFFALLWQW